MSKERLTAAEEYLKTKYPKHTRLLVKWVIELMEAFAAQEVEAAIAETYPKEFVEWKDCNTILTFRSGILSPFYLIAHTAIKKEWITLNEVYQYWLTQIKK
jgi:hypothetical protein